MIRLALPMVMLAAPVWAEGGPTPDEVAALIKSVAAAGCEVSASNQADVIAASGLTPDVAAAVVQRLEDTGQMVPVGDTAIRLTTEGCG